MKTFKSTLIMAGFEFTASKTLFCVFWGGIVLTRIAIGCRNPPLQRDHRGPHKPIVPPLLHLRDLDLVLTSTILIRNRLVQRFSKPERKSPCIHVDKYLSNTSG